MRTERQGAGRPGGAGDTPGSDAPEVMGSDLRAQNGPDTQHNPAGSEHSASATQRGADARRLTRHTGAPSPSGAPSGLLGNLLSR